MRRTTAAAAAAALGLAALGGVGVGSALMTTAVAESATESPATEPGTDDSEESTDTEEAAADDAARLADRTDRITEALTDLVAEGTITQEQADAVASTLASSEALRGPGGKGHGGGHGPGGPHGFGAFGGFGGFGGFEILQEGLATAAEALGITEDDLRNQLEDGDTLGEIADNADVDRAEFVDALTGFAEEQLAERVTAGDLTQEQADEIGARLEERITESLDRSPMGGRGGHRGPAGSGDA